MQGCCLYWLCWSPHFISPSIPSTCQHQSCCCWGTKPSWWIATTRSQNLNVPPAFFIYLHIQYTDLERRGQIKKDRFPVSSSLLLMSLLLSHLLSLFFCWLKFDFHHPSPVIFTPPYLPYPHHLPPPPTFPSSLQGSLFQKSSEAKDKSDLGNSCELLFVFYHLFVINSTFIHVFLCS